MHFSESAALAFDDEMLCRVLSSNLTTENACHSMAAIPELMVLISHHAAA